MGQVTLRGHLRSTFSAVDRLARKIYNDIKNFVWKIDTNLEKAGPVLRTEAEAQPEARREALVNATSDFLKCTLYIPAALVGFDSGVDKISKSVSALRKPGLSSQDVFFLSSTAFFVCNFMKENTIAAYVIPQNIQNILTALCVTGLIMVAYEKGKALLKAIREWHKAAGNLGQAILGFLGWFTLETWPQIW